MNILISTVLLAWPNACDSAAEIIYPSFNIRVSMLFKSASNISKLRIVYLFVIIINNNVSYVCSVGYLCVCVRVRARVWGGGAPSLVSFFSYPYVFYYFLLDYHVCFMPF